MEWKVFYITSIYFLVTAILVFFIQRKDPKPDRWMQLIIYALVVFAVENAIVVVKPFPYLCTAVILAGINEIIFVWRWHEKRKWYTLLLAILFFGGLSYGFFYFSMSSLNFEQLYIFIIIFSFDIFSKSISQLFGRRSSTEKIYFNRTPAGIFAGILMALLITYLLKDNFTMKISQMMIMTGSICVVAFIGELISLWYKTKHNVKTFSKLIPCNGGMLDVFDSFIFVGALWWLAKYFEFF